MQAGRNLRSRPSLLEIAYGLTAFFFRSMTPLIERVGYETTGFLVRPIERLAKASLFDCQMCGQCILHETGMTCPMTCPKNLRNGPCGGVRANGHCEAEPDRRCTWVVAYERSLLMGVHGKEIERIQPPLDQRLKGQSAWLNWTAGRDSRTPDGWSV